MLTEADILTALDTVVHPSFGASLMALGMVQAVRLNADLIEVDLVINCPRCPGPEAALAAVRRMLETIGEGRQVRLCLLPGTWRPPWSGPAGF